MIFWAALVEESGWEANVRDVFESETEPAEALPDRETVCGLPAASSVI